MNKSESIDLLAAALSKAQAEMGAAIKSAENSFFKSSYATFEDIRSASIPHLTKQGLSILQPTEIIGNVIVVNTMLIHSSGQWVSGQYPVQPVKQDPQGYKSALTYARRATWESMVGIATTDDDAEMAMNRGNENANQHTRGPGSSTVLPKQESHRPITDGPSTTGSNELLGDQTDSKLSSLGSTVIAGGKYAQKTVSQVYKEDKNSGFKWASYWTDQIAQNKKIPQYASDYLDYAELME